MDEFCSNPNCHDGWIPDGDNHETQCPCLFWKSVFKRMGLEIAKAPKIPSSPLLTVGQVGSKAIDRTRDNLFIKGWWRDVASHLFIVLSSKMIKDLWYPFKIVTENDIFNVRMGLNAYNARPRSRRDEIPVYNTLADFIGGDFELVIIRLGSVGV